MKRFNFKQPEPLDPGVIRAVANFLDLNKDLQVNIRELWTMEEVFASTNLFRSMSGRERSQLITGCNSTVRLYYEIEMCKLRKATPNLFQ